MEMIKQSCLAFLVAALLGLMPAAPAWADDGGDDGGFDGGDFDDGEEDDGDDDDDQDKDGDGRPDKDGHGHHGGHHHHHHHILPYYGGWGFGPAFGFGAFGYMPPYPPAYYPYPPLATGRFVPPAVYIERKDIAPPAAGSQQGNFWHYCRSAEGYYPQVKECPDGWEQVPPQAKQDDQE